VIVRCGHPNFQPDVVDHLERHQVPYHIAPIGAPR
jgi:hypothetical protein